MRRILFQYSEELSQWDHEIGELDALIKQQANADERIKRLLESTAWVQSAHIRKSAASSAVCSGSITLTGTELHAPLKCPINRIQ